MTDDATDKPAHASNAPPAADLLVRPATASDHDAWLPLWLGYQRFYRVAIDTATTERSWSRILDPEAPMHCALAVVGHGPDAKVTGLVHYLTHDSFWTQGQYCYLQDLFVAPEIRARGIGRALIAHVYDEARRAGCSRVWWLTHETNHDAMKLYDQVADRSGFIQYRKVF